LCKGGLAVGNNQYELRGGAANKKDKKSAGRLKNVPQTEATEAISIVLEATGWPLVAPGRKLNNVRESTEWAILPG
jgi:hypothetical protein